MNTETISFPRQFNASVALEKSTFIESYETRVGKMLAFMSKVHATAV